MIISVKGGDLEMMVDTRLAVDTKKPFPANKAGLELEQCSVFAELMAGLQTICAGFLEQPAPVLLPKHLEIRADSAEEEGIPVFCSNYPPLPNLFLDEEKMLPLAGRPTMAEKFAAAALSKAEPLHEITASATTSLYKVIASIADPQHKTAAGKAVALQEIIVRTAAPLPEAAPGTEIPLFETIANAEVPLLEVSGSMEIPLLEALVSTAASSQEISVSTAVPREILPETVRKELSAAPQLSSAAQEEQETSSGTVLEFPNAEVENEIKATAKAGETESDTKAAAERKTLNEVKVRVDFRSGRKPKFAEVPPELKSAYKDEFHRGIMQSGEAPSSEAMETMAGNRKLLLKDIGQELPRLIFSTQKDGYTPEGSKEFTIQLEPAELGRLSVKLSSQEGVVSVKIFTEDAKTRNIIENSLHNLRRTFEEQGIRCGQMDVELTDQSNAQSGSEQRFFSQERSFPAKLWTDKSPYTEIGPEVIDRAGQTRGTGIDYMV